MSVVSLFSYATEVKADVERQEIKGSTFGNPHSDLWIVSAYNRAA
jgi:hypothetical protein